MTVDGQEEPDMPNAIRFHKSVFFRPPRCGDPLPEKGVISRGAFSDPPSREGRNRCGAKSIRLNAELAKKPPECLEYIVFHEMGHLAEGRRVITVGSNTAVRSGYPGSSV
jgi:Protein of unknown function DUF45